MSRHYNYIYEKLVEDEGDIVGHIAYSLYKQNKAEFITKFKEEHSNNEDPSEDDFVQFNRITSTDKQILNFKVRAELILQYFLETSLEEAISAIENEARENVESHLENVVEKLAPEPWQKSFLRGLLSSLLGAFLFALIVAAFFFIIQNDPPSFLNTTPDSSSGVPEIRSNNPNVLPDTLTFPDR